MEHLNALEAAFPTLTPEEQHMYWLKIHKLHAAFRKVVKNTPPNAGKPWSGSDDTRIMDLTTSGKTLKEIAADMGRTPWSIESRIAKLKSCDHQATPT
jgi:hypothetical protein